MKSRNSSPQTSPQVVKRYRVDSLSTPAGSPVPSTLRQPGLRVEDLPKITMNAFQPSSTTTTTTTKSASPGSALLAVQHSTPSRSDSSKDIALTTSPPSASPLSATSENSPAAWSSAIGYATATGKSGRVIERLMSENDKLKRDLNEQVLRCQELEKSLQTYKPQIEALRQENDNLTHARGVDSNLISRRDRKIEELKAELAAERQRRETAESLARQRQQEKEEMEEQTRREMQSLVESSKHATVHAEILETSHRQLAAEYRARAETWKNDLTAVADGREQDRRKLSRLDVVADQMRQELERSKKVNGELVEAWARLREDQTARLQGMEDENEREGARSRFLSDEMENVVNEMRWLMGVQQNVKSPGAVG
ncbi:hypothetical protein BDY17DRAFT_188292 [Neohortaea acidophila]|uniref:SWI5-dependent HO expression protein 3 n=1 Tax=Neohortaea acidophila TaxID=245834 RepID=A0A6A6PPP7_9PEZI|nr:uncharacterized protein BDY17DRAFT_188292 [Neohortaea acidophila]KAF2481413.1 hypothetical protein BDY17DRAFT_188292 [Neohortaea acidophila]